MRLLRVVSSVSNNRYSSSFQRFSIACCNNLLVATNTLSASRTHLLERQALSSLQVGIGSVQLRRCSTDTNSSSINNHNSTFPVTARMTTSLPIDADTANIAGRTFDYDLLVVGGGSGGISAAKAAAKLGAKVALCDYVRPSPQGTSWGLGGTCVNVGCIPKKLMHTAAIQGEVAHTTSPYFGWGSPPIEKWNDMGEPVHDRVPIADWDRLRDNISNHIGSLNWGYMMEMAKTGVEYINAYARFVGDVDPHQMELLEGDWAAPTKRTVTARRILLATGGRPSTLPIPGAELCVSSDDLFTLPRTPGKTLFVGASYVALECAGFVHGLGLEATVMMRSIPLRGFDQDMANRVVAAMEGRGMTFLKKAVPTRIEKEAPAEEGGRARLRVFYSMHGATSPDDNISEATEHSEVFDTVCLAVGRKPELTGLNVAALSLTLHPKTGKIIVDEFERTNVPHIYAVGDIIEGGLELTPVAIRAGKLLAERLFAKSSKKMRYDNVPTTIFTPLEYGAVGFSEEAAAEKFGIVEVYHTAFTPLEWTVPHLPSNECYMKLIVNPFDSDRVLGFHILAPNAGEIVQAVAVAVQCGATKAHFDDTVGIHPTIAEDMTLLRITKSSGEDPNKSGC